jgi:methionyl-tRNA formyltransferase
MKKMSETILFFGSGPVAAKSLELLSASFNVEAVVTKPRLSHHKGTVPVIETAEKLGLKIYTAVNKKSLDTLIKEAQFQSKVGVLIDFGIIVSQEAIDSFEKGIVNSHFSLLPEWRGADPITFSILSGQPTTGVSLMLLTAGMDEGPILGYGQYRLSPSITAPKLTEDLIDLSNGLLCELLPLYCDGKISPTPQNDTVKPTYSRKLTKDDSILDLSKPAEQIEREIRAFLEWPRSRCIIGSLEVLITSAHVIAANGRPGQFAKLDKQLIVYCGSKALAIDTLRLAGKKEMTGQAFLAGHKDLLNS